MSEPATTKNEIEQAIEEFARENPDVLEALEVFGIATSEYERALRALYPSVTYAGSSTQRTQ
jgi:outer membrane protein TolC